MKCIYILYKTTRIETGEYYIGIHGIDTDKFPDFNDGYLGSGNRIAASVKKHGRKAFIRSILAIIESRKEAELLEAATVTVEMISDPLCLNLVPGGRAGVKGLSTGPKSAETRQKMSDAQKGRPSPKKGIPHSVDTCQKISSTKKGVPSPQKGIPKGPKSAETRQKISDSLKGRPSPKKGKHSPLKGIPKSEEHNRKNSEGVKAAWVRRKATKLLEESVLSKS